MGNRLRLLLCLALVASTGLPGCTWWRPWVRSPEDLQGRDGQRVFVNATVRRAYTTNDAEHREDVSYEIEVRQRFYLLNNDIIVVVPSPYHLRRGGRVFRFATVRCYDDLCHLELRTPDWDIGEQ